MGMIWVGVCVSVSVRALGAGGCEQLTEWKCEAKVGDISLCDCFVKECQSGLGRGHGNVATLSTRITNRVVVVGKL